MSSRRAYRTELDPNDTQRAALEQLAGATRWVYNRGLALRDRYYRMTGKSITQRGKLGRQLTKWRRRHPWLGELSFAAEEAALEDLDFAYDRFFAIDKLRREGDPATLRAIAEAKERKDGKPFGFPRFRAKYRWAPSIRLRGTIHVREREVQLPTVGSVRLHERGYLPVGARVTQATVSRGAVNDDRWFVSVLVEEETGDEQGTNGTVLGIDMGLTDWLVVFDGERYRRFGRPEKLRSLEIRLARLQRKAQRQDDARKAEGRKRRSNHWRETQQRIARLHREIADQRENWAHEVTSELVGVNRPGPERPRAIVIEDLRVSNMVKNRKLARAIQDAVWSEMRRQLAYKCERTGEELVAVNPAYTSQRCPECGHVAAESRSGKRFGCVACGHKGDADDVGAWNVRDRGLQYLAEKASGGETGAEERGS